MPDIYDSVKLEGELTIGAFRAATPAFRDHDSDAVRAVCSHQLL